MNFLKNYCDRRYLQFLPVELMDVCSGNINDSYKIVNILDVIDAIDLKYSKYDVYKLVLNRTLYQAISADYFR